MILLEHYEESILELALQDTIYEACINGGLEELAAYEKYLQKLESNTLTEQEQNNFIEVINEDFYYNLEKYSGVLLYEIFGYNNSLKSFRLNVSKKPSPASNLTPKSDAPKTSMNNWMKDAPYRVGSAIKSGIDKAKSWYGGTRDKLSKVSTAGIKQNLDNYRQKLAGYKSDFGAGYRGEDLLATRNKIKPNFAL